MDIEPTGGVQVDERASTLREPVNRLVEVRSHPRKASRFPMPIPFALRSVARKSGASDRAIAEAFELVSEAIGPPMHVRGTDATLRVHGAKNASLRCPVLVISTGGRRPRRAFAVIADPLVVVVVTTEDEHQLRWHLLPGGPSVTARADGLRMLRAMISGGRFSVLLGGGTKSAELDLPEGPVDFNHEWSLFEDLATIEEWSGATIPVPQAISSDEATRAANSARWIRTRRVPISFEGPISFVSGSDSTELNEMRIWQRFGIQLFGSEIPLGEGSVRFRVDRVERSSGEWKVWPRESAVMFWLQPPEGRRLGGKRTQHTALHSASPKPESRKEPSYEVAVGATRSFADAIALLGPRARADASSEALIDATRDE